MSIKKLGALCVLSIAFLLSACEQQTQDGKVQLKKVGFAEWDKQLASYRPDVVVVDAWAMWCTSCIKRFPKMVEMKKAYSDKNVHIVALNLDEHQDTQTLKEAEAFLTEIGATFDNYHMDENLIDAFDHLGLIGIPAVLIYDGEGNERFRLTGDNPNDQFTDKDIEAAINELLAEA